MPAQWTGDVVGTMHIHGITVKELAEEAGLNSKYLSTVLHGHKYSKRAEECIKTALARLIATEGARE